VSLALATPAVASEIDEATIATLVESVAVLADGGHFEALENKFADEVEVDYTSLGGGEIEVRSSSALMNDWASLLPGFDQTRHALSDIDVEVTGATATATAKVVADHYLDEAVWTVTGGYRYCLALEPDGWVITAMAFDLASEEGSRDLLGAAVERAAQSPNAYVARQQTKEAVVTFLSALESKDMEAFAAVLAEDVVQDMPYSPVGFPKRVSGRDDLIAHYAMWPEISGEADFTDALVFHTMQDPERVFVEYTGEVEILTTGRIYRQIYGGLFHVENGKITLFREYYDPIVFAEAFGLTDGTAALGQ